MTSSFRWLFRSVAPQGEVALGDEAGRVAVDFKQDCVTDVSAKGVWGTLDPNLVGDMKHKALPFAELKMNARECSQHDGLPFRGQITFDKTAGRGRLSDPVRTALAVRTAVAPRWRTAYRG